MRATSDIPSSQGGWEEIEDPRADLRLLLTPALEHWRAPGGRDYAIGVCPCCLERQNAGDGAEVGCYGAVEGTPLTRGNCLLTWPSLTTARLAMQAHEESLQLQQSALQRREGRG